MTHARGAHAPAWLVRIAALLGYRIAKLSDAAYAPVEIDELTGFATREALLRRLDRALVGAEAPSSPIIVMRIDIDDLERINEALSHAAGDQVIYAVANRIAQHVGDRRNLARIAGAAFVALIEDASSQDDVHALAHQLRRIASEPVIAGGHVIQSTVSIGIAIEDGCNGAEVALQNATLAVRRAKEGGGDRVEIAAADYAEKAMARLELEEAMRVALVSSEFRAWYQPIVDIHTGVIDGYEALIRWIRADGHAVYPSDFIPVAEASGMVPELDIIVLAQSLALLTTLPAPQFVAVNVSPVSLTRPDFVRRAAELLEHADIDLERLHLEVTETALPPDLDVVRSAMLHLSMGGAQWYFDDFGTGYSSMSNLGELPVDGLKLDMSFTRGIHAGDETSIRLAHGLLGLARGLELATVAEGVETDAVAEILRDQGWERGQGWLYGKAAPLHGSDAAA